VDVSGDDEIEERQHDEVEHDRHDHFARAKARLERARNGADDAATNGGRHHAGRDGEQRRRTRWHRQSNERSEKPAARELAFGANVEQPGADA
jgi:hypothetical protein